MDAKALTISIVIPAYNEESYIRACLDAIAAQTDKPDKVLVVDNNSTDQTVQIAQSYPFVTVLHEPRQGVVYARDRGFDAATTDVIGRIDADTVLPPNWVHTVKRLLANPAYAAVNGPVFYYDMPGSPGNYWVDHQVRIRLYRGAPHAPFLFGSNSALRRNAWQAVRDDVCRMHTIHEDLDLAIHLMLAHQPIRYDRSLLAGTSARRYNDGLRQWRQYMRMYLYTYQHHDIYSFSVRMATGMYWLGYLTLRFLRRGKTRPRKNPMAG
jgi:glycosyltransferase involved in cell wall biosynthesis